MPAREGGSAMGRITIIWTGWGFSTLAFCLAGLLAATYLVRLHFGTFYTEQRCWPIAVGLVAGGVPTLGVGLRLNRGRPRLGRSCPHSLYYLPMEFWGIAMIVGGQVIYVASDGPIPWNPANDRHQAGHIEIVRTR